MTKQIKRVAKSRDREPKASAPVAYGAKKLIVVALLSRERGASIEELLQATGWRKRPSVHGLFALLRKEGHQVTRVWVDDGSRYLIVK